MKSSTVFFLLSFIVAAASSSCADHPYETDGHNDVRLPESLKEEPQEAVGDSARVGAFDEFKKEQFKKEQAILDAYKPLHDAILANDRVQVASFVDFPLDAESADAFDLPSESIDVQMNEEEFLANYDFFFRPVFIQNLERGGHQEDAYVNNGQPRLTIRSNTLDPATDERAHALECGHQIRCGLQAGEIRIDSFALLCGGIL